MLSLRRFISLHNSDYKKIKKKKNLTILPLCQKKNLFNKLCTLHEMLVLLTTYSNKNKK